MAGRGAQTFKKRQKEMQRKEKAAEKFAKRLERKNSPSEAPEELTPLSGPLPLDDSSVQSSETAE